MLKKSLLLAITFVLLITSCSKNDDVENNSIPEEYKDILFTVTSTSTSKRAAEIKLKINGEGLNIGNKFVTDNILPFNRSYSNQRIPASTTLSLSYKEGSSMFIQTSGAFNPHVVTLKISADTEVLVEKEFTITESGTEHIVEYAFD